MPTLGFPTWASTYFIDRMNSIHPINKYYFLFIQRFTNLLIDFTNAWFFHFNHFSVVGHKAVNFTFNVSCLGINCSREASFDHFQKSFTIFYILIGYFFRVFKLNISSVFISRPEMTFQR